MAAGIRRERLTARIDGPYVLFLIGMRINQPLRVHKWWPVATAMTRMLRELYARRELGFLHAEMWFARTTLMVQYWRSMDQLLEYAKARESQHLPAWQAFNRAVGSDGSVGIWHETYQVQPGGYENLYANMPPFGLGRAGVLESAVAGYQSAEGRLRGRGPGQAAAHAPGQP